MQKKLGPKGKHFTPVINKVQMEVIIQLADGCIKGTVHVHPENRLLDELNEEGAFLPVTNASAEGLGEVVQTAFLALRKDAILYVTPQEEVQDPA
jgi:hypothetical protein